MYLTTPLPALLPLVAGRCIPSVEGALEFGGEAMQNLEQQEIDSEILAKASYYLAQFYKTTEVKERPHCWCCCYCCVLFDLYSQ